MEILPQPERRFTQAGLPWVIAAAGLLTYLATLNHWLTLSSLALAAEVRGWQWQPMLQQPVLVALTWPLRWLPANWTPVGINVFGALCASLTLGLLARSVALLPQDRLAQQRDLARNEKALLSVRSAWVPPVLGAVALGLQLTFWEHATAGSGEILELLLFAGVIWCILEHRCDPRSCWLNRASFLCGVALANSWAMAGFVPLVAVALIRSQPLRFFNISFLQRIDTSAWRKAMPALAEDGRFFLRLLLFWLAGLSLVLLLPLVNGLSAESHQSFWQAEREVAGSYPAILIYLVTRVFGSHKEVTLLLAVVSLVPALLLSFRWRATSDNASAHRLDPVSLVLYASHAFLLALCIAVAFDPPFSPRELSARLPFALPFLPLYYLGALSIGYYSGFFLLVFSRYPGTRRRLPLALHWTAPIVVYALLGLTLAGLVWKNLPTMRLANGRLLEQYAGSLADSLPPGGAVVCSHDSARLTLLRAALIRAGRDGRYMPLDANALGSESYRAWVGKRYPHQWTDPEWEAKPSTEIAIVDWLARSNRVCYLQPAYGSLSELFFSQPRGLVYELKRYAANVLEAPKPTGAELAENEAFWKRASKAAVDPLARVISEGDQPPPGLARRLMERAHIKRPVPDSLRVLARWYSSALNCWGVMLQCNERWQEATSCFAKATELNADNLPAQVNLQCNTNRLAGREIPLVYKSFEELAGKFRNLSQVILADGPFEDPDYCFRLGQAFVQQQLPRQAGQQLERAQALAPKETAPRLALGDLLASVGMPDRALQLVAQIQADLSHQPHSTNVEVDLAFLEAKSWYVKTNQAKAERVILSLLDTHPGDLFLLDRAKRLFAAAASYTCALRITERQLERDPDNLQLLQDKGILCLDTGQSSNAIPVFTRVLSITNSYTSRMYRAGAYLQTGQWEAAMSDYKEALRAVPGSAQPCYRLADIFSRRGDTNTANQYFQQGVSNGLRIIDEQVRQEPGNLQALQEKARLCVQAGQLSNAIPVLTRMLSLTNSHRVRLYRAQAYSQTGQWEAAVADFREVLRDFPASYEPFYGLADVAFRKGDTNAANHYYQQGVSNALRLADEQLRLAPDNPQTLQDKGILCMQAGEYSNAIPVFTRLLSLTNTYGGRIRRAQAYLQSSRWNEAQSDYEETLRLFPTAYPAYYGLAEVALRRGQTNVAIQRFNQYLSKAPTNEPEFRMVAARLKSLQPTAR